MKKLGLLVALITIGFSSFAQAVTLQQKWDKIYDGFYYNVGSYPLMFCIKHDFFFTEMKTITNNDIENPACLTYVEKFFPIASSDIKKMTEIDSGHPIMDENEDSRGKKKAPVVLSKTQKGKIMESAKEVQQILVNYTVDQNQNLIDFYELTLRTSSGPVPGGTNPEQSEFFRQVRALLKLKPLSLGTCTKFHSKDLCGGLS